MIKPKDIEVKEFKKVPLGYSPEEVDIFLDAVYVDYERLFRENATLTQKLAAADTAKPRQEMQAQAHSTSITDKSLEKILKLAETVAMETKETAQMAAEELRISAESEAVRIQKEAKLRAEDTVMQARSKLFDLEQAISELENRYELMRTRVKLLLYAEIELLDKNEILSQYETQNRQE